MNTNIKGHATFFVDYWWLSIPLSQFNVVKRPPYEFDRHSAHASTLLYTIGYTMYQIDKQTVRDNRKGRNTVPQEDELMVKDPAGWSPRFFFLALILVSTANKLQKCWIPYLRSLAVTRKRRGVINESCGTPLGTEASLCTFQMH